MLVGDDREPAKAVWAVNGSFQPVVANNGDGKLGAEVKGFTIAARIYER